MSTIPSFNAMLLEHLPLLRPYAMSMTRNWAAADDLLQEAAYLALRGQNQFVVGTNFRAWMTRIVRNAFISSLRRSKRVVVQIDEVPEGVLTVPADQEEAIYSRQIAQAVNQLDVPQREVLRLICTDGLSYIEAAKTVNCAIGTVKSRLWRARRQLDELLADRPTTPAVNPLLFAHPYSNAAAAFPRCASPIASIAHAA